MAKRLFVVVGILTLAALSAPAQSQSGLADALIGTWILNVSKSTFNPGPGPKSQRLTWQRDGTGYVFTVETVTADGKPTKTVTRGSCDGKPYAVEGSPVKAMRTCKRIDADTYEDTDTVDGKVRTSRLVVLAKDGKTLTVTVKGTNAENRPTNNLTVFEKQ
jgi:hypothetical protein